MLHKIVATKHEEILRINLASLPPREVPVYPFAKALKQTSLTVIAECKKGSPSGGVIRADYSPVEIAKQYEISGASAISVLTDENYFFGSLSHLRDVSRSVKIPVIRKDFILHESQIEEAFAYGASAILLIVRILEKSRLEELYLYAKKLGLGVLVETHNQTEVETSLSLGMDVIGINTRDLDTFQIHSGLVQEMANLIPKHLVRVAESGVHSYQDFKQYEGVVDSVLVGTYFMKQSDIASAYDTLTKLKS
ncbi:indole-3-glycerol phosphate synthase TrpC [Leptospira sp. 'Mane']|uniref:indole-3-glycerol phosphate synthase TrpC n=1 Tax=Leptospira sp. 'Mane' TaxID=3387407 RepID=UPI00398B4096